MLRRLVKKILSTLCPALTWKLIAASQNANQESDSLIRYARQSGCHPSFVEFGFHAYQYNSVGLTRLNYEGLLLDGDAKNCELANFIFRRLGFKARAVPKWITRDTLDPIFDFIERNGNRLGILNVDIDGNDYWILRDILERIKPEIICVEHNASFGLRSLTIPYSDNFLRDAYHKNGWYHGASISAFEKLLSGDYALIENIVGLNLIFLRKDKLVAGIPTMTAKEAYQECLPRNTWSGTTAADQWDTMKDMPFVEI